LAQDQGTILGILGRSAYAETSSAISVRFARTVKYDYSRPGNREMNEAEKFDRQKNLPGTIVFEALKTGAVI
jgi:hypothetical protein